MLSLLFQQSSEAVVILNPAQGRNIEVNPAARALFGACTADVAGRPLIDLFNAEGLADVQAQIGSIGAGGRVEDVPALLSHGGRAVTLRMVGL